VLIERKVHVHFVRLVLLCSIQVCARFGVKHADGVDATTSVEVDMRRGHSPGHEISRSVLRGVDRQWVDATSLASPLLRCVSYVRVSDSGLYLLYHSVEGNINIDGPLLLCESKEVS
jgi:hypothetical protein